MPKKLSDVLSGTNKSRVRPGRTGTRPGVDYAPKMPDENGFVDMHDTEEFEDRVGNGSDVYNATNIKQATDGRHGHTPEPKSENQYYQHNEQAMDDRPVYTNVNTGETSRNLPSDLRTRMGLQSNGTSLAVATSPRPLQRPSNTAVTTSPRPLMRPVREEAVEGAVKHYIVGSSGQNLTGHTSQPHFNSYEDAKAYQKKFKHVSFIKDGKIVKGTSDKHGFITVANKPIMHGSKEHLSELKGMLDKARPGSTEHWQTLHAISSIFGDKHIPAKHKNVKPHWMEEEAEGDDVKLNLSDFKAKHVPGLYNFDHFEHPNGSFIQISPHGHGVYQDSSGNRREFNSHSELRKLFEEAEGDDRVQPKDTRGKRLRMITGEVKESNNGSPKTTASEQARARFDKKQERREMNQDRENDN